MASNYPPGFGNARDLDNVEGPLTEEELDEACPNCGWYVLVRTTWRSGPPTVDCDDCDYQRSE